MAFLAAIPALISAAGAVGNMVSQHKQAAAAQSNATAAQAHAAAAMNQGPSAAQVMRGAGQSPTTHPLVQAKAQQALEHLHTRQQQRPLEQHQETLARQQVAEIIAALKPELDAITASLSHRATQVQATAEHRTILDREAYKRDTTSRLSRIEAQINRMAAQRRRY